MAKAVRLDKFLADAGKGTRSEVKKFIQKGQVQVNGAPAKKPELKVDPEKDTVILSGETVGVAPEFVYYLLNKPAGCVSATEDRNDRTVMEYVPSDRKGIFPVGRLDKDTEGLLLITDDGMLAHELLAPGNMWTKPILSAWKESLQWKRSRNWKMVWISAKKLTMPAKVEIVGGSWEGAGEPEPGRVRRENLPEVYTELHLTIHEGKFHQVKRMMEAVGTPLSTSRESPWVPSSSPTTLKKENADP